MGLLKIE